MGKDVYFLKNLSEQISNDDFPASPSLVFTKVATSEIEKIQLLESLGFNLIDTNILLCKENTGGLVNQSIPLDYSIRLSKPVDCDHVGNIARDNFRFSRFHQDQRISKTAADRIKQVWAKNFFSGTRGDYMIIACYKDQPVGFCQILLKNTSDLIIDLIAVDSPHHGVGLASAMINFLINQIAPSFSGNTKIMVGTQISNLPSLCLYQKLGFKIISSDYVFHYHS